MLAPLSTQGARYPCVCNRWCINIVCGLFDGQSKPLPKPWSIWGWYFRSMHPFLDCRFNMPTDLLYRPMAIALVFYQLRSVSNCCLRQGYNTSCRLQTVVHFSGPCYCKIFIFGILLYFPDCATKENDNNKQASEIIFSLVFFIFCLRVPRATHSLTHIFFNTKAFFRLRQNHVFTIWFAIGILPHSWSKICLTMRSIRILSGYLRFNCVPDIKLPSPGAYSTHRLFKHDFRKQRTTAFRFGSAWTGPTHLTILFKRWLINCSGLDN